MDFKASPHLIPIFDFDILHLQVNTPLFILVLVLVVMFCLNKLLYQPVLRTLERRAALIAEITGRAGAQKAEVERLTQSYDADLAKARAEVATVRQLAHTQAVQATDAVLAQARKAGQDAMDHAMTELRQDVTRARGELAQSARKLAAALADRVMTA